MVIISGNLEESVAHSWLKNITNSITSVGGTVHGTLIGGASVVLLTKSRNKTMVITPSLTS
jgi:hypothetical protein